MVEDRYLDRGSGRTSAQEHGTTLPQSSLLPRRGPAAPAETLPSSGWKSCRQGGDVLSRSFASSSPLFPLSRKKGRGEKKPEPPSIPDPACAPQKVETDFLPHIFLSSSFFLGFDGFSMYSLVRHTFDCFSKIDRGRKRRVPGLS